MSGLAKTIVKAHVYVFLKLPTIAKAPVGKKGAEGDVAELAEHRSESAPQHNSIALPHMLAQFYLGLKLMFVPVSSLVISTHGVAAAEESHHCPRRIAKVERGTEVMAQYRSLPQSCIYTALDFGGGEGIFVAEELRTEILLDVEVIASMRVGEHIARVIHQLESECKIPYRHVLSVHQFGTCHLGGMDVVVGKHRTEIKVVGKFDGKGCLESCLPALHLTAVFVIVTVVESDSPESRGKGEEIHGVFESVFVLWEDVCASYTEKIESHGGNIAEERHVGRRQQCVCGACAVKASRHKSKTEFYVGVVVRAANHTEVKFLVLLVFVGIVEIVEETR